MELQQQTRRSMARAAAQPWSSPSRHLLLAILPLLSLHSAIGATRQKDADALRSLRQSWEGSSVLGWYGDPCYGPWLGITCDDTDTAVVELILPNQGLKGVLLPAVANLTDLITLDLSFNGNLMGRIPPEIGNLEKLESLALQYCNFSGHVPSEIGKLTALIFLSVKQNSFTGPIPSSVGELKNLQWFDVANNHLDGCLPVSTTGGGLDSLINAQHFHLQNNSFSGSIPSEIFNQNMSLIHLLLHSNSFEGYVPPNVGDLVDLSILRLDCNKLSGPIPASISNLSKITAIQLSNNSWNGIFPNLSDLANLQILAIDSGNLTGNVPPLFSLNKITQVFLRQNKLYGTLDLHNVSSKLIEIDLEYNNISFVAVGNYTQILKLHGNPICNNPRKLPDSDCSFSLAPLPLPLPQSAPSPSPLSPPFVLDCTCHDKFEPNPTAASCICAAPIVGVIEFAAMNVPTVADIIPVLKNGFAAGLNLTKPDQIELRVISPRELVIWLFPFNNISWDHSRAIQIYHILSTQAIKFLSYGTYSFYPSDRYDLGRSNEGLSDASRVGIGTGVTVIMAVILLLTSYARAQKKRADQAQEMNRPFTSWIENGDCVNVPKLKGAQYFSFSDLRLATSDFSKSSEIGVGGYGKVYKGVLHSGQQVAIKRAKAGFMQGMAEFKNEIELLSRVHHKNLVGLLGFCFEQGEQMLVYEYMPNGTLENYLSGVYGNLNWKGRIRIALESAKGIAYLHLEANPPIIHRDIKSSNILLDEKLVAKVADFGLSVVSPDRNEDALTGEVKGTFGYLDPEYYTTQLLTEKSDVYSFGVLLLVIITAKRPIVDGRYIVRDIRTSLNEGGIDSIKPYLDASLDGFLEDELQKFVSLALCCVKQAGVDRPTMDRVVKELEALDGRNDAACNELISKTFVVDEGSDCSSRKSVNSSFKLSGAYTLSESMIEPK